MKALAKLAASAPPLQRIVINGAAGSGKSTLADALSERWDLPAIHADALFWEADWRQCEAGLFRSRVDAATSGQSWIFDGNYSLVRELVWSRAQFVIWLDFPLSLCVSRVLGRSLRRAWSRQELWNGNREGWRRVLSRDSVIGHTLRMHARRRQQMPPLLEAFGRETRGQVLVARSPHDLERKLRTFKPSAAMT